MTLRALPAFVLCALLSSTGCGGEGSSGATTAPPARVADASDVTDASDAGEAPASRCWTLPAGDRAPAFQRLSAPVEVIRDSQGIPHLYAANDADVYYASGYEQAVDRLFSMELMRRTARGTLAAVLGPDKLPQDRIIRLMQVVRYGVESGERTRRETPEVHRLIDAWVAGVNRRVREVTSGAVPRPPGFASTEFDFMPEPWTVDDPYLVSRLLLFKNANQLDYDLLATLINGLLPEVNALPIMRSLTDAYIVPPDERPARMAARARPRRSRGPAQVVRPRTIDPSLLAGVHRFLSDWEPLRRGASNNWAVAGRHTANGRPLLAGDPHQALQAPSVFWAQHMNSAARGGSFDVAGFSFVGGPGVHLGHNARVGWTATTAYPDMMDVWTVGYNGDSIDLGRGTYPLINCPETIAVRGAAAAQVPIELVPGRGVLLPVDITPVPVTGPGERLLFNWTGFRATNEAAMFFGFDRARTADEFDGLVRQHSEIASFNFLAADAQGLAYRSQVLVPDRGDPRTMLVPNRALDGANPRSLWGEGFVPMDSLPHSRGGARGFLNSSNNDPFGFTSNGRVDDDPFYYGVWCDPGARAARVERELTRLTARGRVTVDDMEALQSDTYDLMADEVLPALDEAWRHAATDPALATYRGDAGLGALRDQLMAWDRRMQRESSAAVAFEGFHNFLARDVLRDDVGVLFDAVAGREPVFMLKLSALTVNRRFPEADRYMQGGRDALVLRALADTRDWLVARFGGAEPSRYRWEMFHRTRFLPPFEPAGPFDAGASATHGSTATVNVSDAVFLTEGGARMTHESRAGAAYRMVISFNDDGSPTATMNFPMGNSGVPGSVNWMNTHDDWVNNRYRAMAFTRAAVEADARERTTIVP